MAEFAQLESVQALALALVHFVWQGALIALAAALLMRVTAAAGVRYAIGVGAMVVMMAAPVATFLALNSAVRAPVESAVGGAAAIVINAESMSAGTQMEISLAGAQAGWWSAAGVLVWFAGMVVLSIRLAGGWFVARSMATRAVRPAADHVQAVAVAIAERLALGRAVRVLESSAVAVPVLVGWLRPTVVFPVAALAGLSPAQIEALLAHELAHVRRHDYLVNLLQSLAEVVLFYHPAVWWMSKRIRTERELCCDDLAVGICDRLVYATALTDLAAMRTPRVALAATGGDLLTRVRRILGNEEPAMSAKSRWIPAVIVSGVALAAVPVLLASVRTPGAAQPQIQAIQVESTLPPAEPIPAAEGEQAEPQISREDLARRLAELREQFAPYAAALAVAEDQSQERERLSRAQRELEERARQAELDAAKANLDRTRRMFEVGMATQAQLAEAEAALAMIAAGKDEKRRGEIEIERAMRQLADARTRFEIGLVGPDELARLELELARIQTRGNERELLDLELSARLRGFERSKELFEKGLMSESQLKDNEKLFRDLEQKSKELPKEFEKEVQEKLKRQQSLNEFVRKEIDQKQKERAVDLEREVAVQLERLREVAPEPRAKNEPLEVVPSRPIAEGDMLFISIEGESQLPTMYRIERGGSIRVPLLGAFKVIGQTPGQVREAIGKRLLDAKLGSPARVKVELRR